MKYFYLLCNYLFVHLLTFVFGSLIIDGFDEKIKSQVLKINRILKTTCKQWYYKL